MKPAPILTCLCLLLPLSFLSASEPGASDPGPVGTKWVCLAKVAADSSYVQSGLDGRFYLKSVPPHGEVKAVTRIFKVTDDTDELVDTYDWYAPCTNEPGVVLGWSPIAGKVAVMRVYHEPEPINDARAEFSFYLGGKLLKTYTTKELSALGARPTASTMREGQPRASLDYKVLGCQQVPGTNDYRFVIQLADGRCIFYDILTGERVIEPRDK